MNIVHGKIARSRTRYVTEVIAREVILLSSRGRWRGWRRAGALVLLAKVAPDGKTESLEALPEALDEEDDDLPF